VENTRHMDGPGVSGETMNTFFALMAEYGTGQIPLERCAHLFGLEPVEAARRAGRQSLPVPTFRAGSQKSPWLVDAGKLASYLDELKTQAARDWHRINRDSATKVLREQN
jgi:Pyocin activator protein PrtN